MTGPYDDILNLPHPVSSKRPRMSMHDRAAQFAPFAALAGYDAAIQETARLTTPCKALDETQKEALSTRLNTLADQLSCHPVASFTHFVPDARKEGGAYVTTTGTVRKIDRYERAVYLEDGTCIPIETLVAIEGSLFESV